MNPKDKSNGYEAIAPLYLDARGNSVTGTGDSIVADWARSFPKGAIVLDVGCGSGLPISQALINNGIRVYGLDASPTLVTAFRNRFPGVPIECSTVEESNFFDRSFDGIVAWGLMFLLTEESQRMLIPKMANALIPRGKLLFTSPRERCSWDDIMTGLPSLSLGYDAYRRLLGDSGLTLRDTAIDEGENFYYFAERQR